ncbi:hypothetical protein BLOT_012641 [Blomia tropicalis]|nr:hypothetical protein BLOT_012641 [Blomia tropicalis]
MAGPVYRPKDKLIQDRDNHNFTTLQPIPMICPMLWMLHLHLLRPTNGCIRAPPSAMFTLSHSVSTNDRHLVGSDPKPKL